MNNIKENEVSKLEKTINEIIEIVEKSNKSAWAIFCWVIAIVLFFFPAIANEGGANFNTEKCIFWGGMSLIVGLGLACFDSLD